MRPLGTLTHAWTAAPSMTCGWARPKAPSDDYLSGSGRYAEQALRRLGDRLRERRGSVTG